MCCPSRHSLRRLVGSGIASRVAGHPRRAVGSDALSESPFIATIGRLGHYARVAGHPRRAVGSDALSESPFIATIGRLGHYARVAGHPRRAVGSDALSESPFIATIGRLGHYARVAGHPRRAVGSDALSESPLIATIGRLGHYAQVASHQRRAVGSDALSESPFIATIGRLGQRVPGRRSPKTSSWLGQRPGSRLIAASSRPRQRSGLLLKFRLVSSGNAARAANHCGLVSIDGGSPKGLSSGRGRRLRDVRHDAKLRRGERLRTRSR